MGIAIMPSTRSVTPYTRSVVRKQCKLQPMNTKTVEQLENNYWAELDEYPTDLVKRCHEYRRVPLNQMTVEQMRTLILQKIGVQYLLPKSMSILRENLLVEGDCYPGDLLYAVSRLTIDDWKNYEEYRKELLHLVEINYRELIEEMSGSQIEEVMLNLKA